MIDEWLGDAGRAKQAGDDVFAAHTERRGARAIAQFLRTRGFAQRRIGGDEQGVLA